jgi:DNA-binding LytR/AlgR family response regulator
MNREADCSAGYGAVHAAFRGAEQDAGLAPAAIKLKTESKQPESQFDRPSRRLTIRIAIKVKGRICFTEAADVVAIEAAGNYVTLRHRSGSYMLRESLAIVEEKLTPYGFIRIHRSVLVNSAEVIELKPLLTGEYVLVVSNGKEYTVSRTYKANLKSLALVWIGKSTCESE